MTPPDDLGIRLLMARTGISREEATVMWYAPQLLEACRRVVADLEAEDGISVGAEEDMRAAIEKATRPEEG